MVDKSKETIYVDFDKIPSLIIQLPFIKYISNYNISKKKIFFFLFTSHTSFIQMIKNSNVIISKLLKDYFSYHRNSHLQIILKSIYNYKCI